jgi:hypothetical protein
MIAPDHQLQITEPQRQRARRYGDDPYRRAIAFELLNEPRCRPFHGQENRDRSFAMGAPDPILPKVVRLLSLPALSAA